MPIRIAIVGLGKIAHDQHIPAIRASAAFELVAAATLSGEVDGVPIFRSIEDLLASDVVVDAIAMCHPPQARFDAAAQAIRAGKHVLLEKPPGATLGEVEVLRSLASAAGTTLFAAWHSRFAPGVAQARDWLSSRDIGRVEIVWKEDVRRWHPGQQWIWEAGGLGVFDPGINALSILTEIVPQDIILKEGILETPSNRHAPIGADLALSGASGAEVRAIFDWRQEGPQTWDIRVMTDAGMLTLSQGGAALCIEGHEQALGPESEYLDLYAHFARLLDNGSSDLDCSPLRIVADAFLRCRQEIVTPFHD